MDGHQSASLLSTPLWITRPAAGDALGTRPFRERRATFLTRDLSEAALQQPAEPSYTPSELEAAREVAFSAGHAAGAAEAEESRLALETMTLAAVAGSMAGARETVTAVAEAAALALAKTLIAAMSVSMPELMAASALGEVNGMIAALLPGLAQEPQVRVDVAPEMQAGVSAALARSTGADGPAITIIGKDGMSPGAAKIIWSAGQALREPQRLWQDVTLALQTAMAEQDFQRTDHA